MKPISRWLLVTALVLPAVFAGVLPVIPPGGLEVEVRVSAPTLQDAPLEWQKLSWGADKFPPRITHVQAIDFDGDGRLDVLACDAARQQVVWRQQQEDGTWAEHVLADNFDLASPSRAAATDLDQDGDLDVVVSLTGGLDLTDDHVGRVVWLERTEVLRFRPHVLLEDVRPVADTQAGDLDGDGDVDLAVAVCGRSVGGIWWLENRDGRFREHRLLIAAGCTQSLLADYDGDGDLDIAAVAPRQAEILALENTGDGVFDRRPIHDSPILDLGRAALAACDLDQDGDTDLLLAAGGALDLARLFPQPDHGCLWLENEGGWHFADHRIANVCAANAAAGDHDGDGDQDVVLVAAAGTLWLENNGRQQFRLWQIAGRPTHLASVACGDLNGDGRDDIVAGALLADAHQRQPRDQMAGVLVRLSRSTDEDR